MRRELASTILPMTRYSLACGVLAGTLGNRADQCRDIAEKPWRRLKNTLVLAFWGPAISYQLAIFLALRAVPIKTACRTMLISGITLTGRSLSPKFMIGLCADLLGRDQMRLFPSWRSFNDSIPCGPG